MWLSTHSWVAALNFGPHELGGDLRTIRWQSTDQVAIYAQLGGDLRTHIVTSSAPVGAKKVFKKQVF